MKESIHIEELAHLIDIGADITLLDVRRKADFLESGRMIPGAGWRAPESAEAWKEQISKTRQAVVYCVKGGPVSRSVADTLKNNGIDAVFLEGGIKAWAENGLPLESGVEGQEG